MFLIVCCFKERKKTKREINNVLCVFEKKNGVNERKMSGMLGWAAKKQVESVGKSLGLGDDGDDKAARERQRAERERMEREEQARAAEREARAAKRREEGDKRRAELRKKYGLDTPPEEAKRQEARQQQGAKKEEATKEDGNSGCVVC